MRLCKKERKLLKALDEAIIRALEEGNIEGATNGIYARSELENKEND